MKHLNPQATAIIRKLHDAMHDLRYARTPGRWAKIDNGGKGIMPVSIERLDSIPGREIQITVSHTFVQNGDLMFDPEMIFVIKEGKFYPITYRQDNRGIMQEVFIEYDDKGKPTKYRPEFQRKLVEFANEWMLNINSQQNLEAL